MTMILEVNRVEYNNFMSASCEIRLDALTNTFSFTAVAAEGEPLPFSGGDVCRVIVEDQVVLTGNIEVVSVDYNGSDHIILIQGRDSTGDLLDSTLDPISDLREAATTLKKLIEIILDQIGLSISVIDEVNPEPFNVAEDIASPEAGENAFSFIEKYSRKKQVLLTSDAFGNIVITQNSGESVPGAVQHIIGANDNNVLLSSFRFDTTGRYNIYKMASQLNPSALFSAGTVDLATVVNQGGGVFDADIRASRQLVLISEAPTSDSPSKDRAQWEKNIRKARGLVYSATVEGYRVDLTKDNSDLWQINKLYQIIDDFLGKQEPMLCNTVTFTLDLVDGQRTTLGFVDARSYKLDLTEPVTSTIASDVLF